ncbi:MAG: alanine racemase [Clostridia bacterium]|nr:alanine racemase [Clostridia bacterium]
MLNKAVIDLQTLRENASAVKLRLDKKTLFNAVVKADAYGHGAPVVANALYNIVDNFSVATVEEGVALRLSGIRKDIFVLTPLLPCDLPLSVRYGLIPTVCSVDDVAKIQMESTSQNRDTFVQIKFNAGMNRLGVDSLGQLESIIRAISDSKRVKLWGMFSHFSAPQNKKSRISAENKFLLANNLVKGYNNKAVCHISSSGGFLVGAHYDMVRIGILLYGYTPFKVNFPVQPVMKVYAPVIARRTLKENETALYGDKRSGGGALTLIRYGYADGLERKERIGQFNNRCMDVTAMVGDYSGELYPVMENAQALACKYDTISYEILTKCALRAQKIYLN